MNNDPKLLGGEAMTEQQDLPAGCFSSWLRRTRHALVKENGATCLAVSATSAVGRLTSSISGPKRPRPLPGYLESSYSRRP